MVSGLSPWTSSASYQIVLNNKPDFLELADAEGFDKPDAASLNLGCARTNVIFTYVQTLPRLDLLLDHRGFLLSGVTNRTYRLEYNGRLGSTSGWTPLTNLTLPPNNSAAIVSNTMSATSNRFYRAVRVP